MLSFTPADSNANKSRVLADEPLSSSLAMVNRWEPATGSHSRLGPALGQRNSTIPSLCVFQENHVASAVALLYSLEHEHAGTHRLAGHHRL
jgi:hypothetical protein